jgi:hypothetical protein
LLDTWGVRGGACSGSGRLARMAEKLHGVRLGLEAWLVLPLKEWCTVQILYSGGLPVSQAAATESRNLKVLKGRLANFIRTHSFPAH